MAKTRSRHQKDLYASYKSQNRFATNRKRKLLKLQKQQPNNEQITEALKNIKYRRKTPGVSILSTEEKRIRGVLQGLKNKRVGAQKAGVVQEKINFKHMFTLGTRAHTQGVPFWKAS